MVIPEAKEQPMKIDIYYSSSTGLQPGLQEAIKDAIEATSVEVDVNTIEIHTYEEAKAARFMGSPTVRVNGIDVEYGEMEPPEYTTGSRFYNTHEGWKPFPAARRIANSILEALQREGKLQK
jgi:hypothetical protein